jgi:hypothetical protein
MRMISSPTIISIFPPRLVHIKFNLTWSQSTNLIAHPHLMVWESINTSCNQWLSLAKIGLEVPHVGRDRSLVARAIKCVECISLRQPSKAIYKPMLAPKFHWCFHSNLSDKFFTCFEGACWIRFDKRIFGWDICLLPKLNFDEGLVLCLNICSSASPWVVMLWPPLEIGQIYALLPSSEKRPSLNSSKRQRLGPFLSHFRLFYAWIQPAFEIPLSFLWS